ncbi:MAG: hypothetical protein E6K04_04895 [Methanobacteriota archaeon]|nr:MAG: hypothetical protein E6K04_04895 [Euryarchaeota archaeon]
MKWVTREKAKVDRIACPWLITKFVDPKAEFLFVPREKVLDVAKERGAIPYDSPGAELFHYKQDGDERCSFDAIIKKYKLTDPALLDMAEIVRAADAAPRNPRPGQGQVGACDSMSLRLLGHIELPAHVKEGGFDHAAVHHESSRLYVAHTSNDDVDVIDSASDRFLRSIHGLKGAAGVLVSDERNLLFTANRGENTISILSAGREQEMLRLFSGIRPNGLAFDPSRGLLLVANVGDPEIGNSSTASMIDVDRKMVIGSVVLPGRPRWAVYDERTTAFYLNIADPPLIAEIDPKTPSKMLERYKMPAKGPHGLDLDPRGRYLFCACDGAKLVAVHLDSGEIQLVGELSGPPDVVFFNPNLGHVYVAVGTPGVIDVFDARRKKLLETVPTEKGAHTLAVDQRENKVYAFLPATHRAATYRDE